jgi:Xaa-Pro dipeptidase
MSDHAVSIPRTSVAFHRDVVARVQARLEAEKLDGMLLLNAHNVIYASGFFHSVSERPIGMYIPAKGEPALFVPLLEQEHAAETWVRDIRIYFEYPGEEHPTLWMARETGAKRLGIDSLEYTLHGRISALGITPVVSPMVEHMRYVKTPEEIELTRMATRYADFCVEYVYKHAADIIRDEGSELAILNACLGATSALMKSEIENIFQLRGGGIVGTVHSGDRAALPHGSPGKRVPQRGDTLIVGIGAMVGGYHAESGATFIIGEPNADQLHCLKAAADCRDAAISALRTGATCTSVNEAALGVLREARLADAIRHRIGHGMGLQGHESPWLAPGDETIIAPNMVFSNEPGIYRPGIDGYRTIVTMIATDNGADVPNQFLFAHPPEACVIEI